jgi:nucleotide-binding universal stress UspA family protein
MALAEGVPGPGCAEGAAGFRSIVVALDLEASGDRALAVARSLALLGRVPVELLTVSSPNLAEHADSFELAQRAAKVGGRATTWTIAHDHDPVLAIVRHVESRDDALLVMATAARAALRGHLLGSVSEEVLSLVERPALLVGPRVSMTPPLVAPTLVACVDGSDVTAAAVPAIAAWTRTFGGATARVAEVVAMDCDERSHAVDFAGLLADAGIAASHEVLRSDGEPSGALLDFGARVNDPIFVATSVRWTDGKLHRRSTTRRLVQQSTRPVLVVPAGRLSS